MRSEIPPDVLAVSPVPTYPRQGTQGLPLPLNIVASIVSYVRSHLYSVLCEPILTTISLTMPPISPE
jgi:hypothetical protein